MLRVPTDGGGRGRDGKEKGNEGIDKKEGRGSGKWKGKGEFSHLFDPTLTYGISVACAGPSRGGWESFPGPRDVWVGVSLEYTKKGVPDGFFLT